MSEGKSKPKRLTEFAETDAILRLLTGVQRPKEAVRKSDGPPTRRLRKSMHSIRPLPPSSVMMSGNPSKCPNPPSLTWWNKSNRSLRSWSRRKRPSVHHTR